MGADPGQAERQDQRPDRAAAGEQRGKRQQQQGAGQDRARGIDRAADVPAPPDRAGAGRQQQDEADQGQRERHGAPCCGDRPGSVIMP